MDAKIELTPAEHDELLKKGRVEIDDPERGHILFSILFDENKPGIVGKKGLVRVLRSGSAAKKA
jgi:hypothetical protein